jgi:hypothetical protein
MFSTHKQQRRRLHITNLTRYFLAQCKTCSINLENNQTPCKIICLLTSVCNIGFDPKASLRESTKKRSKPTLVARLQVWRKQKFATDNFLSRKSSEGAAIVLSRCYALRRQSTNSTAAALSIHYLFKVWSYQWFSTLLGKNTNRSILRSPFRDKKISTRNNPQQRREMSRDIALYAPHTGLRMREKRSCAVRESRDRLKKRILLLALVRRRQRRRGVDFIWATDWARWTMQAVLFVRPNAGSVYVWRLMRFAIHVSPGARDELSVGWLSLFLSNTHTRIRLPIRSSRFWCADFACFLAWPHVRRRSGLEIKLYPPCIWGQKIIRNMHVQFFSQVPKKRWFWTSNVFLNVERIWRPV